MVVTVEHLMTCGFRVVYGYTQSDEISLLFHRDEDAFERKLRKFDSLLAGEASACFSLRLGGIAAFDCRISQLPSEEHVLDYFLWRQEDATRNALNANCYWQLRKEGKSVRQATDALLRLSVAAKNELLFERGTNFAKLPAWQRRGVGLFWERYEKAGRNPKTGQATKASRRRVKTELELPMKKEYESFIRARIGEACSAT
jgi:tRNA(His) 5'-end guanylyltransferase